MSEMLSDPIRIARGRLLTEFYRWLPASAMFLFYVAGGSMLHFTCAIALMLGATVNLVNRD